MRRRELFLLRGSLLAVALAFACRTVAAGESATAAPPAAAASSAGMLPSNLPLRRDAAPGSEGASWAPSALLLALTGAAGAGMLWWRSTRARGALRANARSGPAPVLRLSSQALTPQASVHAVRWDGEEFLVGCTAHSVTLLSRRNAEPEAGAPS